MRDYSNNCAICLIPARFSGSRLLIDLSWNSSRLEGNTYSLLDTRRLIEFGEEAQRGNRLEAQMILNHKDAIAFLVSAADEIGFNRYTILNLHGILAQNLLPDEAVPGRLRRIAVGIEKSAFHPLEVPQLIEECFNQLLATAQAIHDPFEQSFFAMVQLPYLSRSTMPYSNYAREHWMQQGENPPVGLILCAEKGTAEAHYALDNLPNKALAAEYQMVLPD